MFRPMRRSRQQLSDDETHAILRAGRTAVLAVSGDDGYPYAVPVNYVYTDECIYFHCAREGHKLDAIRRSDKVSLCVIARDEVDAEALTDRFTSVIVFGRARILTDEEEVRRAIEVFGLGFTDDHAAVDAEIAKGWDALCMVEVTVEHATGKEAIELARRRT
ncbi:MAG: pyridoxamine 5'-phosphate oxidase family protein [Coriobacteriales bacterium]